MSKEIIFHITNDYSGSTVYKNLVGELDKLGLRQIVYTPVKEKSSITKNKIDFESEDSEIIYSHILNKTTDRVFYKRKIKKILRDIELKVDLTKVSVIHAHTWYSDGGIAYLLSKKYNIPYIVGVRNTDLNIHYKYFVQHRKFGLDILNNAKNIILIGEYQRAFFDTRYDVNRFDKNKIIVIPNGVDPFWIENVGHFAPKNVDRIFRILYVGTFLKRKNLKELQEAIIKINAKNGLVCQLHIVGGGGEQTKEILDNIAKYPSSFIYHGKIYDKAELKDIYNNSEIFAMPSRHETFGLVYVEAMLQGLPILYTANEGIDGFYEERVGEKVVSADANEIKEKLLRLITNYDSYVIPTEKLLRNHNWQNIASRYLTLYSSR